MTIVDNNSKNNERGNFSKCFFNVDDEKQSAQLGLFQDVNSQMSCGSHARNCLIFKNSRQSQTL